MEKEEKFTASYVMIAVPGVDDEDEADGYVDICQYLFILVNFRYSLLLNWGKILIIKKDSSAKKITVLSLESISTISTTLAQS